MPWKDFTAKLPPCFSTLQANDERLLVQLDDPGLVVTPVPGQFRGCIAEHDTDNGDQRSDLREDFGVVEIAFDRLHAFEVRDGVEVDADNAAVRERPLHLEPAPGCRPEIHDVVVRPDDRKFFLDLEELVGCPGAVSLLFCPHVCLVISPL